MIVPDLISVVIPVYNVELFLRECVDSVLQQSYRQLEVILINDGSTDESGQICDGYATSDPRVKVIHKVNGGASTARNEGMRHASGEFIYFLDSDDYLELNAFEILHEKIRAESADFVFFNAWSVFDTMYRGTRKQGYTRDYSYPSEDGLASLWRHLQHKEFHASVPLLLIRREFLLENNIMFTENIVLEDMIFTFMLFSLARKVAYVDKNLYFRRYRENSVMSSKNVEKKYVSAITVYNKIKHFLVDHALFSNAAACQYIRLRAFNVLTYYLWLNKQQRLDYASDHRIFLADLAVQRYYGDTALRMRCHGVVLWFLYKLYEKSIGRLVRRCGS